MGDQKVGDQKVEDKSKRGGGEWMKLGLLGLENFQPNIQNR